MHLEICSHHCLSNEWVTFLSLSSEKICHCLLSANREWAALSWSDIRYDEGDITMRLEWSLGLTPWPCSYEMKTILTSAYSGQIRFTCCYVCEIICLSRFSLQKVSTPDRRHVGFQRVATSELESGPRDYKQLWQNAIKQQIILGMQRTVRWTEV